MLDHRLVVRPVHRGVCHWDETESYRALVALEPWDDPSAADSAAMSDRSRRQLFGEWFATAYDEPGREAAA